MIQSLYYIHVDTIYLEGDVAEGKKNEKKEKAKVEAAKVEAPAPPTALIPQPVPPPSPGRLLLHLLTRNYNYH